MREIGQIHPVRWNVRPSEKTESTRRVGLILILTMSAGLTVRGTPADVSVADLDASTEMVTTPPATRPGETPKDSEWVVAPIPMLNPAQGFGVVLAAQYIYKPKEQTPDTPSSLVGLGGFYTEKGSWGVLAGYAGHWQDDLWRPVVGGGYIDLRYDFYGIGNALAELNKSIRINQTVTFGLVQLMRRIVPGLYAGARLSVFSTDISTGEVAIPPLVIPPLETNVANVSGGPVLQWDTRDNQFYPTRGQNASLSAIFYGGDHTYQIYSLAWNTYYALEENQILAFRAYFRSAAGDVPFYALSQFGLRSDLRGYKSGKYRDRDMFAGQVEYRGLLRDPWGFVLFAGAGEVAASYSDFTSENILASVGGGLRYRLGKTNPVNLRLDWAYGKDGGVTYLSVNEAF